MFRARLHVRCNRLSTIILVHICMWPGSTMAWHVASQLMSSALSSVPYPKIANVEERSRKGVKSHLADIEAGDFGGTVA